MTVGTVFAAAGPSPIDGPSAQRLAQQELSRPEYRQSGESWLDRVLDAIGRFLDRLFGGGSGGSGGHATLVALVVVGALIVGVVVFAVVRAGRLPRRRRSVTATDDPLAPEVGVDHAARAAAWLAQGAYAEALREYLRDAVATLERRGWLEPRPGRTGAGAAREGGAALPTVAEPLAQAAAVFDPVWFGGRPASAADVEVARVAAEAVRAAAAARPAASSGSGVGGANR